MAKSIFFPSQVSPTFLLAFPLPLPDTWYVDFPIYPESWISSLRYTPAQLRKWQESRAEIGAKETHFFLEGERLLTLFTQDIGVAVWENYLASWEKWKRSLPVGKPAKIGEELGPKNQGQVLLYRFPWEDQIAYALLVCEKGNLSPKSRWELWANLSYQFLLPELLAKQNRILSFKQPLERFVKKIQASWATKPYGTLVLFQLQELTPYFRALGIVKSQDLMREVIETVQTNAKPGEIVFPSGLRSVCLYCPGISAKEAEERLQGLYFPSTQLIIDYKLSYQEIRKESFRAQTFQAFFTENF